MEHGDCNAKIIVAMLTKLVVATPTEEASPGSWSLVLPSKVLWLTV